MRTLWIAASILSVCAGVDTWAADGEATGDEPAPDFVLKSLAGPNLRLSEYRGEVVMVTFWASWCGECRGQLKDFNDIAVAYGDAGLTILSVNLDSRMPQARETAQALDLVYPVLFDPEGEVAELYDVRDVPFAVFVDREGRVRETIEGYSGSDETLFVERLRNLLRE
jgi:peroxiredoxin